MQCNWLRALACAAMLFAATAHADTYPSKPVTMVVPYPAGGATDVVARAVAERLTQSWGQSVIVENRAGAGTTIGASSVARARGDGYTLFMTTSAHTISGHLYSKLNYDPVKDFAPITLVTKVPLVLVINPAIPAKTLPEFLAYLKQNGASVNFASPGNGTAQHLSGELFKIATQSNITHVPYRGDAPAFTDLAGGQVQMMLATITSALPLIESGKLRALAVANGKRVQALRDVRLSPRRACLASRRPPGSASWRRPLCRRRRRSASMKTCPRSSPRQKCRPASKGWAGKSSTARRRRSPPS